MLIIGEILRIENHPNAEKLVITEVNVGDKLLQVITNDKTVQVNDKVVVAMIGHKFDTFEIKETTLRGYISLGMFCGKEVTNLEGEGVSRLSKDVIVGSEFIMN
jgi:phenylalanyl-tRNA synthetase beta chain